MEGRVCVCGGVRPLPPPPPLQNHTNEDIYDKAVALLETYFDVEDGEVENLAPAVAETGGWGVFGVCVCVGGGGGDWWGGGRWARVQAPPPPTHPPTHPHLSTLTRARACAGTFAFGGAGFGQQPAGGFNFQ